MNIIKDLQKQHRLAIHDHEDYRVKHFDRFDAECVEHLAFLDGIISGLRQAIDILKASKEALAKEALANEDVQEECWTGEHKCNPKCTEDEHVSTKKELLEMLKRGIYANDSGVATDFYSGALAVFGHNK